MKQNFSITDKVEIVISGEIDGVEISSPIQVWISEIRLSSSDKERYLEYGLTTDLPDVCHYGKAPQWWKTESKMKKF